MPLHDEEATADETARMAAADGLRGQAAACRRLSSKSRTRAGAKALIDLGDHFDEQARKLHPSSLKQ